MNTPNKLTLARMIATPIFFAIMLVDFKYHYLRHTYGTRLAEMNTPTHLLCNQMGHASGKVTEQYYLAVSKTGIEVLQKKLNQIDTDYKSDK